MTLSRRTLLLLTLAGGWCVFGAGCAGVPDTKFLKREYREHVSEFETVWAPISTRTKAAVLAAAKAQPGELDILERQASIEGAVVGAPLVLANKVTLLIDGPATYAAMFGAIRAARSTVNIEFYIIQDDETGRQFAELLAERAAAGVKINLIYDSAGSLKTNKEYFEKLRAAGIKVVEFNPLNPLEAKKGWAVNHRDHRKQVIVDGRIVVLGGINIDDVYATSSSGAGSGGVSGGSAGDRKREAESGWRDTDIQIEGPVVADFQKLFLETWRRQKGPPLDEAEYFPAIPAAGREIVRAIGSSPEDQYSSSYLTFIAALTNAEKQVLITNAYFVPDPQLVSALVEAAQRGVDVRLILPRTTDSRAAAYAAHSHYRGLLEAGVKIYERQGALLHAKTAVVDGVWSMVGSSNLDWRSAVDNDELNAVIISADFAARMIQAYALDQAKSDMIDLETWKKRPLREKIAERSFRLIERLL